ncbi:MAG: exodeoxyribonuclease VII small subunit [Deltaproteobacteria bacterium CG_4_10_14_0_2_um_filter_43_8]|nr:MAG: exodeoxyribonuclease VII small subunit [Deltaproteobacteria bacterium CG11_big_fil_rev_8_21_14_0_20_49_13]PJA21148.1 MAG: exodeoxyribonuclease VII small subunit [Deltaproteobacteria bacterium CG_4_10_14_0_2_um_filter_43_8]
MAPEKETFERSLSKLEEVVRHLEKGDLSLDDSLKTFEEGIKWSRMCESKLKEAKGKVEMLMKTEGGELKAAPFKSEENA